MIDGLGNKGAGAIGLKRASLDPSAAVAKANAAPAQASTAPVGSLVSQIASEGPPVDSDKVAAIRGAIAEGRHPVDPAKIADRMLALDLPGLK